MTAPASTPRLEPADRKLGPDAHWLNVEASTWYSDPANLRRRPHQLLLRKRRGTRAEPVRRTRGLLPAAAIEESKKERRQDVAAAIMRLVSWAALHCDWRTNQIGNFREGRIHYPSRTQIADGAGFPVLVDSKDRVRAWEMDDRMDDAIAAGFFFRLVDKDSEGRPSEFKVRALVWELAGLTVKRQLAIKKAEKEGRRAKRPPKPAVAAVVGALAAGTDARARDRYVSVEESPPEARGWPRKPKPPPT